MLRVYVFYYMFISHLIPRNIIKNVYYQRIILFDHLNVKLIADIIS